METADELKVHESYGYSGIQQVGEEIDISDKPTEDVIATVEKDIEGKRGMLYKNWKIHCFLVLLLLYFGYRPKWCPSSKVILQQSEELILASMKTPYNGRFVNIGPMVGSNKDCLIWTVSLNENSTGTPLVLLHGFGAGVGFWALNLKTLSQNRPVYAIDILGFARSSRPKFSSTPEIAETELVDSIEGWRLAMNLPKIALVGHSFGGYLSTCYSIRYPEPVAHLILADPWGFKDKPEDIYENRNIPLFARMLVRVFSPLNPLSAMRLAGGSLGPKLIQSMRADIIAKFESVVEDPQTNVAKYIYHCNAQNPTGESAFHSLQSSFGWAKNPLNRRLHLLDEKIPITIIYGSRSWLDHLAPSVFKEKRPNSFLDAQVIKGAGHHIYADELEEFNKVVLQACRTIKVT